MSLTFLLILLALVLVALIWMYNALIRNRNLVAEAWAGIDVQLQKRHELVPNLVVTVKAYVSHESGVFERIAKIRSTGGDNKASLRDQETNLSRSLGQLFALAEDYPDLKASESFQQLHQNLVDIEDQLQYARRYYNGAVRDHNNMVQRFPSNLVAAAFDFPIAEFFEIELASQRSAPNVSL